MTVKSIGLPKNVTANWKRSWMYQMSLHNKIEQLIIVAPRCDVRRRKDDGSHSLIDQDRKNKIVTHN